MINLNQKPQKQLKTIKDQKIRKPAVAGSFYPGNKEELNTQLNNFFKKTKTVKIEGQPRILIVPHAGIIYSGEVAAWGFKQIEEKNFSRIILLGASHTTWFNHAAIDNNHFWQTPLGKIALDLDFINNLIDHKKIIPDPSPFVDEHSLEIELIFLQKVLKNFKIVPILISEISEELISVLSQKLAENFDNQTLLVVSTDLSHYPTYEVAVRADESTIKGILSGKKEIFEKTIQEVENAGYPGLETAACGQKAVAIALKLAEILGIQNWQKIYYANSGDISGDYSRVVGYASIIASTQGTVNAGGRAPDDAQRRYLKFEERASAGGKPAIESGKASLDPFAQKEALQIARKTLEEYLTKKTIPDLKPQNPSLLKPLGCFTTLRNKSQLRGCIGEFEPDEPLYKVIQKTAINAATRDYRFPPVEASELKDIKIEISVMTPKQKISDWREIKLGKHGVVVQKGLNAGTFLPQVATETGWSLEEFLSHLCAEKAGLPSDCYKDPSTKIFVFEVQVFEEK